MKREPTSYDQVNYPGRPYLQTHPASLAAQARLLNLNPAPPERCRVLELGCADGTNLLGMAAALPESQFVGVELAASAVRSGTELARESGLSNVALHQADLAELDASLGVFDYVIAHGVYSWVPDTVRDALLAACKRHLAPAGLAFVSYSTYPGAHLRQIVRDMMEYHGRDGGEPLLRVARGREFVRLVRAAHGSSAYGSLLDQELERLGNEHYVVHDDFVECHQPVYFHAFAAHAARHGLAFLLEASGGLVPNAGLPGPTLKAIDGFAGQDPLVREQYLDFARGTAFRQSLLGHDRERAQASASGHEERALSLFVQSDLQPQSARPDIASRAKERFVTRLGHSAETDEPLIKAIFVTLAQARPRALSVAELLAQAEPLAGLTPVAGDIRAGRLRAVTGMLFGSAARRLLTLLASAPRFALVASERPVASPLVRAQALRGDLVTNLRHEPIQLDSRVHPLVLAADGARSQAELQAFLAQPKSDGRPQVEREIFERILEHGVAQALFVR